MLPARRKPVPSAPGVPRPPVPPDAPQSTNVKKKVIIHSEAGNPDEKHIAFSYSFNDDSLQNIIEMNLDKVMAFELPDFDQDFHFESENDGEHRKVMLKAEKPVNSYRLEFNLDEPGNAKISVQGKDGKMLYEESLESVEGYFHRDFDLQKYAGATLQLNVQSGKSKQSRKVIL